MSALVLALPGNEALAAALAAGLDAEPGTIEQRRFPDGESYVRVCSEAAGRDVLIAATLHRPDPQLLPLYFLACTLRELGARRIVLVAPYLAYMRQDKVFHPGEGVTARHFAHWLSGFLDGLVTVDPHLHRIHALAEVYRIPTRTVAAAPAIAAWLRAHCPQALLIGPDAESEQWVAAVAKDAGCPFTVLSKERHGDRDVRVSLPQVEPWRDRQPVLLDDIISSGHTLAEATRAVRACGLAAPLGVGVHAVLAEDAADLLREAGLARLVTCNTINDASNAIDLHPLLVAAVADLLAGLQGKA